MPVKYNISDKGKAWRIEAELESLSGRAIGDNVKGSDISADLDGYELEITGASDFAGFAHKKDVEGTSLRRVILTDGWGMHKKPRKEGKKKVSTPNGLRLRKTVRGKELSEATKQINLKVVKPGSKKIEEVFPDQNKAPEPVKEETAEQPAQETEKAPVQQEAPKEEVKAEVSEEKKE